MRLPSPYVLPLRQADAYQYRAGVWEADLRRQEARPSSASPVSGGGAGRREELRGEELLQVGAQDAEVGGVVDASAINRALQEAVDKLPLERFTAYREQEGHNQTHPHKQYGETRSLHCYKL